jgi:hypothetical protein
MADNPVILLADAGPLITLAYADALDVLLLPNWQVQMVDMVLHEVTRNPTPTSQKLPRGWRNSSCWYGKRAFISVTLPH